MSTKRRSPRKNYCQSKDLIDNTNQLLLNNIVFQKRDIEAIEISPDYSKIVIYKPNAINDYFSFNVDYRNKLGSGSYSKVYKLFDNAQKVHLALKIEENDFPSEKEISDTIWKNKCGAIDEIYIGTYNENHLYLMSLAQGGTLEELKTYTSDWTLEKRKMLYKSILEQIRKQIVCLLNSGFVYSDFKLDNILVDCDQTGIKIYLGDLGSAVPNPSDNEQVATYPPPEMEEEFMNMDIEDGERGFFKIFEEKKESIISWGLGMLSFLLISDDAESNHFLFSNKYNAKKHDEAIQKLNYFYGSGFGDYLHKIPNKRKSINEAII